MEKTVFDLVPELGRYMRIDDVKAGSRFINIEGEIREPLKENIRAVSMIFKESGFTPFFERTPRSSLSPHLLKVGMFSVRTIKQRTWLNWLLFAVTFLTTTFAGAFIVGANIFENPLMIWQGLPYSLAIILILGSHELGHYLTCRYYKMQATPPFFIPFLPPFGTMGAVIRMGLTPSRRALIRIGASGPIVGFLVAVAVSIIGIATADIGTHTKDVVQFGEPLAFKFLEMILKPELMAGRSVIEFLFKPVAQGGAELKMNPLVTAGWLGFFITALNLLPLSQLDGGHIAYGLLGKRRNIVIFATYALLAGVAFWFRSWNWLVWGVITLAFGFRHPPSEDEITTLGAIDVLIAVAALLILVLTVVPVPITIPPTQ